MPTTGGRSNVGWRSCGSADRDNEAASPALSRMPKEGDRKAILGCLGGVLNITCAHQFQDNEDNSGTRSSTTMKNAELCTQTDTVSFSVRESDTIISSHSYSASGATSKRSKSCIISERRKRTSQFQKDLLRLSADLLVLPPDTATVFLPNLDIKVSTGNGCENDAGQRRRELLLDPYLQSLSSPEESFRCLALLLFRFLLASSGEGDNKVASGESSGGDGSAAAGFVGYDARVRATYKALAVSVLSYWDLKENKVFLDRQAAIRHAARKFENLEDLMAKRIRDMSKIMQQEEQERAERRTPSILVGKSQTKSMGQHVTRSLKIAGAGIAAGTVFAITGGLAAPAIVGGIATLTGMGTLASVAATLLMIPAATTIFGVAGGGLVAKKMTTRTSGLGDFNIERVHTKTRRTRSDESESDPDLDSPELSRTVCVSGWARDDFDFERPWGIQLPRSADKSELLSRFCSAFCPHVIPHCARILKKWNGKEDELWQILREAYGKDPDSLLPIDDGYRRDADISPNERKALDRLIEAMQLPVPRKASCASDSAEEKSKIGTIPPVRSLLDVLCDDSDIAPTDTNRISPKDLRIHQAWDFQSNYGGEQYVISWESKLLEQLTKSTTELQKDLAKSAAGEALKKTALSSLMAAIALPTTLLSLTGAIDETWTLVAERADEAGIALAQSLLEDDSGHRPVSLIGHSFGARIIVSCLHELARQQHIWDQNKPSQGFQNQGKEPPRSKREALMRRISSRQASKGQVDQPTMEREPMSVVEDVVLMGCPASIRSEEWSELRSIVGGRLINCYSKKDLMLSILFRVLKNGVTKILNPPAGIREVAGVPGVENYDVSEIVSSHEEYTFSIKEILDAVGYGEPLL